MDVLLFLLFGVFSGTLANLLVVRRAGGGWLVSISVGVTGALFGGLLGRALGLYGAGESEGLLVSLGSAVLLLFSFHAAALRRMV